MERYGVIYGTDSLGVFGQMAISPNIRDLVERANTPYPMDAVEKAQSLMSGSEQLDGWANQPKKDKPLTIRYGCVRLAGRFDMPGDMKPLYAVSVSGTQVQLGYKKYNYSAMVLVDRRELLSSDGMNYLDHIFGTHLLTDEEMDRVRQGMGKVDPALVPARVSPLLREDDLPAVVTIANLLLTGQNVAVRLEKGYGFNRRALEILTQVYSLLPPQRAVETGFAAYVSTGKIKSSIDDMDMNLFVLPGEVELGATASGCTVVDLEQTSKFPGGNTAVCLRRWALIPWKDRYEAMLKVFGGIKGASPSGEEYVAKSIKFFSDPIFKFKPVAGKCATLEALKEEYDRYGALALDIGFLNETFRKAIPVLMGSEAAFYQQKAEAAARARTAKDPAEQKQYTTLYRFAQKLEPGDASIHAILQTEKLVEEKLRGEMREQAETMEAERRKLEAEAAEDREHLGGIITRLGEENLRTEENLKTVSAQLKSQQEAHEKALRKLKSDHAGEVEKLRRDHEAREKKQKEENLAELKRLNAAHAEELKKGKEAARTAAESLAAYEAKKQQQDHETELRKLREADLAEMNSLRDAHASEMKRLKEAHSDELQSLRTLHASEVSTLKAGAAHSAGAAGKQKQAHDAELQALKDSHRTEIQALKDAHARELKKARSQGEKKNKYVCRICAYVHEGEELASDFHCPICKCPASMFTLQEENQISADAEKLKQAHEAEMKKLKEANLAEINRLKTAHAQELQKLRQERENLLARQEQLLAARAQTGGAGGSAQAVSEKAKQIIAKQLMDNLREVEALKRRHQAEIAALKNNG